MHAMQIIVAPELSPVLLFAFIPSDSIFSAIKMEPNKGVPIEKIPLNVMLFGNRYFCDWGV